MDSQTIYLAATWPKSQQLDALCTGNRMCKLLNFDCSFLTLVQWPEWLLNRWPLGGFQLAQVGQVHERDLRQTPGYSPKKTPCQIDFIKLRSIYII